MSRERFIDPHFFRSESVARLSRDARLTLVGLIATADDHGRGRGSPRAVQLEVFPAGDATVDQVDGWLREIEHEKIARFYEVGDSTFYDLPNWEKYQQPKYVARSKIPDPPGEQAGAYRHPSKPPQKQGRSSQIPPDSSGIRDREGSGGEWRGVDNTPPTPPEGGTGGGGGAAPTNGTPDPEAESAWALVLEQLPRREPTVRNPGAYLATLRQKFTHPREAGLKWWNEVWAEHEARDLRRRILAHGGRVFQDEQGGRWRVDPGGGLVTPDGRLQPIATFKAAVLERIAARLEAETVEVRT